MVIQSHWKTARVWPIRAFWTSSKKWSRVFARFATANKTIKLMNTFISSTAKLTAFLF